MYAQDRITRPETHWLERSQLEDGEEPTIIDPFGGRLRPERLGDAAKLAIRISRLRIEVDLWIGKPPTKAKSLAKHPHPP